jgi:outer membrane murein-binding lipoprotein Lpp
MGNNAKKEKFDATLKTLTEAAKTRNGKIVGGIVVAVILINVIILNVFGTTMENKIATEVQALKSEIAALSAQVGELKEEVDKKPETVDLGTLKADAEAIQKAAESINNATGKASENFEAKLSALLKAEETKLEILTKDLENHKAYIEGLKTLVTGKTE